MNGITKFVFSLLFIEGLCASGASRAGDIYVICHPSTSISAGDVMDIYTGMKLMDNGVKLIPMDNNSIKVDFLSKVVHMDSQKYSTMWSRKVFQDGISPPVVKATDDEVNALVRLKPGYIGYVSNPGTGVQVITKY